MAQEFTDANFKSLVLDSDKLTLIDFWAEWCGPCRAIGPVIEELSIDYDGIVNVGKVNVDHNLSTLIQLVAGDYLEIFGYGDVTTSTVTFNGGAAISSFSGYLVSAS